MSLVLQSLLPYPNSCQGTSPHQQGWDTKMEKLSYGGIDVSKDRLDVVVLPEGWFFSVSNDTAGWTELVARSRPLAVCANGSPQRKPIQSRSQDLLQPSCPRQQEI